MTHGKRLPHPQFMRVRIAGKLHHDGFIANLQALHGELVRAHVELVRFAVSKWLAVDRRNLVRADAGDHSEFQDFRRLATAAVQRGGWFYWPEPKNFVK